MASAGRTVRHRSEATQQGFTMLENAVLFDTSLSIGARLLYLLLKHFAWKDEKVPGQPELARKLGASERAVRTHTRELEDKGLLSTVLEQGRPLQYFIEPLTPADFAGVTPADFAAYARAGQTNKLITDKNVETNVSTPKKSKNADLIFNALCTFEGLNLEKLNSAEGSRVARAKKLILESVRAAWNLNGDDAEFRRLLKEREEKVAAEITRRGERYEQRWSNAERTAMALANHWQQFAKPDPVQEKEEAQRQRGERLRQRMAEKGVT